MWYQMVLHHDNMTKYILTCQEMHYNHVNTAKFCQEIFNTFETKYVDIIRQPTIFLMLPFSCFIS